MRYMLIAVNLWWIFGPAAIATTLNVTIRDVAGHGLVGITVSALNARGEVRMHALTDAAGSVELPLDEEQVLIQIAGQQPDGTELHLPAHEAGGIQVQLTPPTTTLDLRVETDGLVRPDPATMIAPDTNESVQAPTAAATLHDDGGQERAPERGAAAGRVGLLFIPVVMVVALCVACLRRQQ